MKSDKIYYSLFSSHISCCAFKWRHDHVTGLPGNVIHQQRPGGSSVVAACDGAVDGEPGVSGCLQTLGKGTGGGVAISPESLLAGRVPDLQLDRFPADVDNSGAKLHANGVVGVLFDCETTDRNMRVENVDSLTCQMLSLPKKEKQKV